LDNRPVPSPVWVPEQARRGGGVRINRLIRRVSGARVPAVATVRGCRNRQLVRILMLIRCLALSGVGMQAYADTTLRHFEIRAQIATLALKEFARQADISLVYSAAAVANHQTAAVEGDFTIVEGLRRLLQGSGLSFKQVSATTIAISEATNSPGPTEQVPL